MANSLLALLALLPLSFSLILYLILRLRSVKIPIKNRHVFITGGSSGIGLAIALQAASEGARVSILARNAAKLEDAKKKIRKSTGCDVAVFSVDVRDYAAVKKAVQEAGPIDVLVCNQGVFVAKELELMEAEQMKFIIDVNLLGTFHLIKAALPGMRSRKHREPGLIVLVSSQSGQIGIYGYAAYAASKFGLKGMSQALQQEVIADNIRVSIIYPPETATAAFAEERERRPQLTNIVSSSSPPLEVEEVAKKSINGIKSGSISIPCNLEGFFLALGTAGMSPQSSFLMAFLEVTMASIVRFGFLCFQWNWYRAIENWRAKNK